jgi:outer membrane immunogenic protein
MKRLAFAVTAMSIAGGSALAADLPPPMAPPPRAPAMYVPVAPVYNWTGFYIGGNPGAGWNSGGSVSDTLAVPSRDRDRPPSFWAVARSE